MEEEYPLILLDNASEDDAVQLVRRHFPGVKVLGPGRKRTVPWLVGKPTYVKETQRGDR